MTSEFSASATYWRNDQIAAGDAIVFDLDGVLSDATHRQSHARQRDWDQFFSLAHADELLASGEALLSAIDPDLQVVILTGRPSSIYEMTIEWLERHELRWDLLVMRAYGDYSAAPQFKAQAVEDLRNMGFSLKLALDDDPRNADAFRRCGLPCVYLNSGYYE